MKKGACQFAARCRMSLTTCEVGVKRRAEVDAIKGTYKDGTVILDQPANWPEGSRVQVEPDPTLNFIGMPEEQQGDDPESIRRWLEAFDAIPPLQMTPEEVSEREVWERRMKEFNIEAVRRQMEEWRP
jgi:hypothetical protein